MTTRGSARVADRRETGILDTCAYLDLGLLDPEALPTLPQITAITLAELQQGVAMARDAAERAVRTEQLAAAIVEFDPLPFDEAAATRYGTLVALTIAAGRNPRPRRMDLLIAATASARGLALYTRNGADFRGLESMVDIVEL
ncbi:type II toxin-antitoxin system VapC family toxin [Nocardia cyriacigeorgica]|uniref:type II toxin-antitoxin system VapC family toxin n=1 Tax=Nocardia cyriacigeorgica TaxID=135487 RepID=UPI001893F59F|nr:type II toxin-antitoxin system VapC family toxin [Nocardia cyriacigeorgica]MBF6087456.1 type II toxin-antitoxin system VapC family toxin [Nocardia cyriacigeorgica]MBF6092613.1 type II toxin-antitoxin system VapC family toxin [Nocardia cyriacigeorgica]MBF6397190.1 type II toxin-antitoxin system VapC family toxin [Nocardia cyriacigeorgica]MBF6403152.1 type II toxin-antitoxin system VapC family toxin [Nocardia cyriacigeorgica]